MLQLKKLIKINIKYSYIKILMKKYEKNYNYRKYYLRF